MTTINTTLTELLDSLGINDIEINLIGNVTPSEPMSMYSPGSPVEAELINIEADKWQETVPISAMNDLIVCLYKITRDPRYRDKVETILIEQANLDRAASVVDAYERRRHD